MRRSLSFQALLWALVATATGCDDPAAVQAPTPVSTVDVYAPTAFLHPGDVLPLTATPRSPEGLPLTGRTVVWSSDDPAVAQVAPSGILTAVAPGTTRVRADVEGKAGFFAVTVGDHPVASVTVEPGVVTLVEGQALQLTAVPRGASGAPLPGRPVSWMSEDESVVTVTPSGVIHAVRYGSAVVVATAEGRYASALVMVLRPEPVDTARVVVVTPNPHTMAVGEGRLFYADVRSPDGQQVPHARIDGWMSQDTTIATVSSTGIVRALRPGTTRIMARSGVVTGWAVLTVVAAPGGSATSYRLAMRPGEVRQPLDTVDVTRPDGTAARAHLYLRSATLKLYIEQARYEQAFVADVVALDGTPLGERTWTSKGTVGYVWPGSGYTLIPDDTSAPWFSVTPRPEGLIVEQSVLGGALVNYFYMPIQP